MALIVERRTTSAVSTLTISGGVVVVQKLVEDIIEPIWRQQWHHVSILEEYNHHISDPFEHHLVPPRLPIRESVLVQSRCRYTCHSTAKDSYYNFCCCCYYYYRIIFWLNNYLLVHRSILKHLLVHRSTLKHHYFEDSAWSDYGKMPPMIQNHTMHISAVWNGYLKWWYRVKFKRILKCSICMPGPYAPPILYANVT